MSAYNAWGREASDLHQHRFCFFVLSVQRRSDRMDGYWACACVHTSRRTEGEWRLWGLANLSVDF